MRTRLSITRAVRQLALYGVVTMFDWWTNRNEPQPTNVTPLKQLPNVPAETVERTIEDLQGYLAREEGRTR